MGFGPGAISTFGLGSGRAVKWQAEERARAWLVREGRPITWHFAYSEDEDALAVLTRRLCLLRWDDVPEETRAGFALELSVLEAARLVRLEGASIALTERGTFYADSVSGLLAERAVAARRRGQDDNDAVRHGMG